MLTGRWPLRLRALRAPRYLVLAMSIVGALLFSEGLIRIVLGPRTSWIPAPAYVGQFANREGERFIADSSIGWRMRPAEEFTWVIEGDEVTYRANEDGFRSPHSPPDVRAANGRIVLIGDSFAWGTGVRYDQTFGSLLDDAVGEAVVYNLAQPGMGLGQMWMTLRHVGLAVSPTVVILAFIDQDWDRSLTAFRFEEGMNKPTFMMSGGELRRRTASDRPSALLHWVQRHSALWGLEQLAERRVGRSRPIGSWWATNAAILGAIGAEVERIGAELLIVRLPTRDARPFPGLAKHLDAGDAVLLDLAGEARGEIFFETDPHINATGHRVVADAMEPVLRALLTSGG